MFFYSESDEAGGGAATLPTSWSELTKLTASDGQSGDFFGTSVSITPDGLLLAVGAKRESSIKNESGAVYLYQKQENQWSQIQKIKQSAPSLEAEFGVGVSFTADGSKLAIGAGREGKVYIFEKQGSVWSQTSTLDGITHFGTSLSFSPDGSKLAVGSPGVNSSAGEVEIFENQNGNWVSVTNLSEGTSGAMYGSAVSFASNSLLSVGSFRHPPAEVGATFIYENQNNNWQKIQDIQGQVVYGNFGYGVSFSLGGDLLSIGAKGTDSSGTTYIYEKQGDTWVEKIANFKPSEAEAGDYIGSVSLSSAGETLVIGAMLEDPNGLSNAGSVYIFQGT
jgi:WD40 repeat protein